MANEQAKADRWGRVPLWWFDVIDEHFAAAKAAEEAPSRLAVRPYAVLKVAAAIASHVDPKKGPDAWPSLKTIAEEARVSVATVNRARAVLEALGIVSHRRQRRMFNRYTVAFDRSPNDSSSASLDSSLGDSTTSVLIDQECTLIDQKCTLDSSLGEPRTDQTEQTTFKKPFRIRTGTEGKRRGPEPSDALVEALAQYTDGNLRKADREARQALQTVGIEQERALIDALYSQKTQQADRPIGFAIAAVRNYGGVLAMGAYNDEDEAAKRESMRRRYEPQGDDLNRRSRRAAGE